MLVLILTDNRYCFQLYIIIIDLDFSKMIKNDLRLNQNGIFNAAQRDVQFFKEACWRHVVRWWEGHIGDGHI